MRKLVLKTFTSQAKLIEEELTAAKKANSIPIQSSERDSSNKRSCAELNACFDEALMSTYQHIAAVLQNLCVSSNIPIGEGSMVNLASGQLLFDSFVASLSLDILCEKLFKTVFFGVSLVLLQVFLVLFLAR